MPLQDLFLARGRYVPEGKGVRPVLYLLPELDDRGGGIFTGHVERRVCLLELHAVPCRRSPGREGA